MTPSTNYLLTTIKSILHNEPMPATNASTSASSNAIDYTEVYRMAVKSSVANLVAFGICKDESVPAKVRDAFDKERLKIIMQQTRQNAVISDLKEILGKTERKGVLLKGSIIKDLYPDHFMRSMSDIDVFMEEDDVRQLYDAFIERGYSTGVQGIGNHYEYEKNVAKVEFHPELVALDSEYGQKVFAVMYPNAKSVAEEMELWEHTVPYEGSDFLRQLTPDYHYMYVVMHALSHLMGSGTGIRSFIDIWVMNQHYGLSWDRAELNALLERFGLLRFEQYALALADRWFELDSEVQASAKTIDINEDALEALEVFVLDSGTYGNLENNLLKEMHHDTGADSRVRYLAHAFFRPLSMMKQHYPVLKKAPVLLPVMWVYRTVEIFLKRGDTARRKLKVVATADQEKARKNKELFEKVI